ncbi:MAG: hypothetical protein HY721_02930 [Planctomycetes bacterium]|nr:hypothetical protein [Planctomycetota bacterium]
MPGLRLRLAGVASLAALGWATLRGHEVGPTFSASGEGGAFTRGDANQNGEVDLSDAIFTLDYLSLGGVEPWCMDALDADDDGEMILTDAIAVLGHLFLGQAAPPAPFPGAGPDPTSDGLLCDNGLFARLRREVFAPSCASSSCHSAQVAKGGLVLEGMRAYASLVQAPADNSSAGSAELLRVKPGRPWESFLYLKLTGQLASDGGDPMPDVGAPLSTRKLELVRDWIEHGALPSTHLDINLPPPARGQKLAFPPSTWRPEATSSGTSTSCCPTPPTPGSTGSSSSTRPGATTSTSSAPTPSRGPTAPTRTPST